MNSLGELTWVWLLLGVFLVVGLIVHERTGSRLGGVLVLPLLLVYALIDLSILVVFALGTLLSLSVGHYFYSKQLYYGRRLLYVFLLGGLAGSFILVPLVEPNVGTIVMALLPGLFAYNLHREGRYLEGVSTFMIWFGVLLSVITVGVWLVTDPTALEKLGGWAGGGANAMQGLIAPLSPVIAERIGDIAQSFINLAGEVGATVSYYAGAWFGTPVDAMRGYAGNLMDSAAGFAFIGGVTFVSVAAAHGADGAVE